MKHEVKLIALDLDSTLLYNRKFANPNDLKELKRLQDEGYIITLSTGQSYDTASVFAKQLGIDKYINKIICQNGVYITPVNKFKPELVQAIDQKITAGLVNYFKEKKIGAIFLKYNEFNSYYAINFDEQDLVKVIGKGNKVVMINDKTNLKGVSFIWLRLPVGADEEFFSRIEELYPNKLALASSYTDDHSELDVMLTDIHATKGDKLLDFANNLNLMANEILVFGDGGNDISMFKKVKYSVAMGNAKDQVKQAARYVTDSCLDGGVSIFLKKHF